jgi:hypothetical protein
LKQFDGLKKDLEKKLHDALKSKQQCQAGCEEEDRQIRHLTNANKKLMGKDVQVDDSAEVKKLKKENALLLQQLHTLQSEKDAQVADHPDKVELQRQIQVLKGEKKTLECKNSGLDKQVTGVNDAINDRGSWVHRGYGRQGAIPGRESSLILKEADLDNCEKLLLTKQKELEACQKKQRDLGDEKFQTERQLEKFTTPIQAVMKRMDEHLGKLLGGQRDVDGLVERGSLTLPEVVTVADSFGPFIERYTLFNKHIFDIAWAFPFDGEVEAFHKILKVFTDDFFNRVWPSHCYVENSP